MLNINKRFESADVFQRDISLKRVFSPYVDITTWPTVDINEAISGKLANNFILGFIGSNKWDNPAWGGSVPLEEEYYSDFITKARKSGSKIAISFGGIESSDIALFNSDPAKLQEKYEWVIGTYSLENEKMDFYLTRESYMDTNANVARAKAILGLKKKFPGLQFQASIPVYEKGLSKAGKKFLQDTKDAGVVFDGILFLIVVINLLAKDMGSDASTPSGSIIKAVKIAISQLDKLNLKYSKVGITPMIGQNNKKEIVFKLNDAKAIVKFSKKNDRIELLSIWSLNRDNGKKGSLYNSSKIKQNDFDFSKIFKEFK